MISYIHIQNFAIIEEEKIHLHPNFSALTGETGAGKSIILEAITLILGGRASADMIRQGHEQAVVEVHFNLTPQFKAIINQRLNAMGLMTLSANENLQIQRVISNSGKNKVIVNQNLIKQADLKEISQGLIEIVRQHASYALLDPEQHIHLLDSFSRNEEQCKLVHDLCQKYQSLDTEFKHLTQTQTQRKAKIQQIEKQIQQVEKIAPESGEDDRIEREIKMLQSSEKLKKWLDDASAQIYDQPHCVVDTLNSLSKSLDKIVDLDERLNEFHEIISRASMDLSEASRDMKRFKSEISNVQFRIQELEERRTELDRLKDEYDRSIDDILSEIKQLKDERLALKALDHKLAKMDVEVKIALDEAMKQAEILSIYRKQHGKRLSALIEDELKGLGMAQCRFSVDFQEVKLSKLGIDQVEFLISPNPGEGFKPLSKIASGGELSRLTLALKVLMMHQDQTPTYVFDEVDSGIGGGVAEGVGKKLKKIALNCQVISITHLPQVAACADQHYKIEKKHTQNRTYSSIDLLSEDGRIQEMARMLGGQDLTEATILHAKEMIKRGQIPVS